MIDHIGGNDYVSDRACGCGAEDTILVTRFEEADGDAYLSRCWACFDTRTLKLMKG